MKPLTKTFLPLISLVLLLVSAMSAQSTAPSSNQQMPDQQMNNAGQQDNSGQPQTLIDPGVIYNTKEAGTWVGKMVTLKNVTVQDTNKDGNFWVGSDGHHRLLVVKPTSNLDMHAMRTKKGDIVTVTGQIEAASEAQAQKTGSEKGSMKDAENSSGVFLIANQINIASSTQH